MRAPFPRFFSLALAASVTMAGCTVGPDYHLQQLNMPSGWLGFGPHTMSVSQAPVGNLAWWHTFKDPALDGLIAEAIHHNGDLRVALERLKQARSNRLGANAALAPELDGTFSYDRTKVQGVSTNTTILGGDVSWELDLFGGNRRAAEAARANVGASDAARRMVRVSLLAEVASNYLSVRQLQQQVLLTQRNLATQEETLRIVNAQFREGVASGLDQSRALGQVASTRAQLPLAQQNLNMTLNNLAVLVGQQPAEIRAKIGTPQPVPLSTPDVLIGTPASVLADRPDVSQAERNLAAATANEGVAIAEWFPKVNLTALFGLFAGGSFFNAFGSEGLLGGGNNATQEVGGTIALPIIDFGRVRAQVRYAKADQKAALDTYEQVVLAALADVETALTGYTTSAQRLMDLQTAADANKKAVELAQARYREGVVPLLDVLTAQQAEFAAESDLASGQAAQGQSVATLYKALGGGAYDPQNEVLVTGPQLLRATTPTTVVIATPSSTIAMPTSVTTIARPMGKTPDDGLKLPHMPVVILH